MYYILFGILGLFIYFIFDVIEIFKDFFYAKPKNIIDRVYRIQSLWTRYLRNNNIGYYEACHK